MAIVIDAVTLPKTTPKTTLDKSNTLIVWIVSDNKPGHYNQSEGLVQALSKYRSIKLQKMPLVSFTKAVKMLFLRKCGQAVKPTPEVIIGTGHQTHFSLLAYRRCFGGKTVVMMSPSFPTSVFDLCFIPRHDKPSKKENVIETLGAINRVIPDDSKRVNNKGLVLLGGPSKHYQWDSTEINTQILQLFQNNPETKWVIAGSRRTPEATYEVIKKQFPKTEIVLPDDVSADWLPSKILEAEQVWVTSDSVSMIYEALTSGATTGIFKLGYEKPTRITEEIDRLLSEDRVNSMDSENSDKSLPSIYEADRCAKILLEKLGL